MKERRAHWIWLTSLALFFAHGPSSGQSLPGRLTDQCVRATVKITGTYEGGTTSGSGSIIDPRGYVLTNFHVVGVTQAGRKPIGSLHVPENRYQIGTVTSSREAARPRWIAKVVRADARLDLALLRIVSDQDGTPVRGAPFPSVPMARANELRPGSNVWAFGYPLGVRTINVTGGDVTGFEMNARREVAWLRSDAEFNPGNSGGMLVDERGRLVAVPTMVFREGALEPVELARPTERIPRAWLTDLRRRPLDDVRIDGIPRLEPNLPYYDTAVGDRRGLGDQEELLYLLPSKRPAVVRLSKRLRVAVANPRGYFLRRGVGEVEVLEDDPEGVILSVIVPASDEATTFDVRYEVVRPAPPPVVAEGEDAVEDEPPAEARPEPPPEPRPQAEPAPAAPVPVANVQGNVRDAVTGRPVEAMVGIGRPGVDLRAQLAALLAGRITADEFDEQLITQGRADLEGLFELSGVPRGATHALIAARIGYRPVIVDVRVRGQDARVDAGRIDLVPNR